MSRNSVIWLAVGVILIALGIVVLINPGWNVSAYSDELETVMTAGPEEVTAIRAETGSVEIRIYDDGNDPIEVNVAGMDPDRIETTLADGVLYIRQKEKRSLFPFLQRDGYVVIWLPASFGGELSAAAGSGEISLNGLNNPDLSVALSTSSGEINAYDAVTAAFSASSGSGDVYTGDLTVAGRLELSTASGRISLCGGRCGDVQASSASGSVFLSDVRGDTVQLIGSSGSLDLDDVRASSVILTSGSGSVSLRRTDAAALSVETGSGSVWADLEGSAADYAADISTGSGSVSGIEPHTDGDRPLRIKTGSGSVSVSFEG